jgi:hypothetical protein
LCCWLKKYYIKLRITNHYLVDTYAIRALARIHVDIPYTYTINDIFLSYYPYTYTPYILMGVYSHSHLTFNHILLITYAIIHTHASHIHYTYHTYITHTSHTHITHTSHIHHTRYHDQHHTVWKASVYRSLALHFDVPQSGHTHDHHTCMMVSPNSYIAALGYIHSKR